jgi:hypothetical protein
MSRIIHPHKEVYAKIQNIIVKVVVAYPQQSMWSLMAVTKSTSRDRSERGKKVLTQLKVFPVLELCLRSPIECYCRKHYPEDEAAAWKVA